MRDNLVAIREDLRTMAIAVETFHTEHGAFPTHLGQLTTPTIFVALDPSGRTFGSVRSFDFAYHSDGMGHMIWHRGPDDSYDITPAVAAQGYSPSRNEWDPGPTFADLIYDPTNGSLSRGDVVWFRH